LAHFLKLAENQTFFEMSSHTIGTFIGSYYFYNFKHFSCSLDRKERGRYLLEFSERKYNCVHSMSKETKLELFL